MQYTIYLGSKCNMNCPYCHREAGKEQGISPALLNELKNAESIRFMGGEPTLYMGEIKKVVEACPNAKFSIVTNGVEFKKYQDYFLGHKFLVCFSYDGTSLRGFNPFTEKIDYPWVAVSCTLYHDNTNFKQILRKFAECEETVGRLLGFFPHIVHSTYSGNDQFTLTKEEIYSIVDQYKEALSTFIDEWRKGVVNIRWRAITIQLLRRYKANYTFGETYCVNHNLKKVDTTGQGYSCHYIRDEKIETQSQLAETLKSKFPKCGNCDVYDMCGAACVKSKRHELECLFYGLLFRWFKKFYKANEDVFTELEGIK